MDLKALVEFADPEGWLREDILDEGGPIIKKELEHQLGPGPYKVAEIEQLLSRTSSTPRDNNSFQKRYISSNNMG